MPPSAPAAPATHSANLLVGFVLAGLTVLAAAVLTSRAATEFSRSNLIVQHTYEVVGSVRDIESRYAQTVNAVRAFVITRDERFRSAYASAAASLPGAIDAAERKLGTDARDTAAFRSLRELMQQRRATMDAGITAASTGGIAAVLELGTATQTVEQEDAINHLLEQIAQRQLALLRENIATAANRLASLRITLLVFFVASAALLTLFFLRARRHLASRDAAEQEVERQRRFADTIIENAPIGVFIKETEHFTLVRANRFVEEIAGRSRAEMLGRDDSQFVGPEIGAQLVKAERELVNRRQMLSFEEIQIQTPRGKRSLHVRKVLIPDENGQVRYLLGLSEDVTERRRAELGQREFAETLERTSRELASANKELESFSYSVSHDLRAPLRAVEGYAAILEEDYGPQLDAEGKRFVRNIREGATRMGHLIQDLLSFSRLGRQPLDLCETDTRFLVQSVWTTLCTSLPHVSAELVVGELPPSYGDPQLLQQAWTNLLENAIKYSSKVPHPRIIVSGETDGTEAIFSVQDNGVGFDMRYYDKLFNVFQRLHSEADYSGTGVGLAIVHRVIARHGGRIWARSEPGKGACFSFALPYRTAHTP